MNFKLSTAVVLIIFKRPSQTERVFRMIEEAKPSRLYIIADGPRNADEALLCQQTRQIGENVNWDCEVQKNYSETNLGLRNRVISGLDWVFDREESAIILEDDCLPHPTFFPFCEELLKYYKACDQVMHISGDNFLKGKMTFVESYYFSKYTHVWGWATWRRAWCLFHRLESEHSNLELDLQIFQTPSERNFWKTLLEQVCSHRMDYTWDYQWAITCLAHRGLCVMPASNLVSNIGFGSAATHTQESTWFTDLPAFPMDFPLRHPHQMEWDFDADQYSASYFFNATTFSWIEFVKAPLRRFVAGVKKIRKRYEL